MRVRAVGRQERVLIFGLGLVIIAAVVVNLDQVLLLHVLVDHVHLVLLDVHVNAAQNLGDLRKALEVDVGIMLDVHAEVLVHGLDRQFRAAVEVRAVDARVLIFAHRHGGIAHDGGQLHVAGLFVDRADDHGIRARGFVFVARVRAQQKHVQPVLAETGRDAQILNGNGVPVRQIHVGLFAVFEHLLIGLAGERIASARCGRSGRGRRLRRSIRRRALLGQQNDHNHNRRHQQKRQRDQRRDIAFFPAASFGRGTRPPLRGTLPVRGTTRSRARRARSLRRSPCARFRAVRGGTNALRLCASFFHILVPPVSGVQNYPYILYMNRRNIARYFDFSRRNDKQKKRNAPFLSKHSAGYVSSARSACG